MKIIADTNLIVRFIVKDDEKQLKEICKIFSDCDEIIIPTHVFCEFCWVLSRSYKVKNDIIVEKIELLAKSRKVNICDDEVMAGLKIMKKGGDFADGVNCYAGNRMSADKVVFASSDRKAIRLLSEQGIPTLLVD